MKSSLPRHASLRPRRPRCIFYLRPSSSASISRLPTYVPVQLQNKVIPRPSVGQSKKLLKQKILGSIGGGPYELLRAFRKMHRGSGVVSPVVGLHSLCYILSGPVAAHTPSPPIDRSVAYLTPPRYHHRSRFHYHFHHDRRHRLRQDDDYHCH